MEKKQGIVNGAISQIKGASKMFFIINLLIAALNIWILKDQRHVSFLVLGEGCQAMAVQDNQLQAFYDVNH